LQIQDQRNLKTSSFWPRGDGAHPFKMVIEKDKRKVTGYMVVDGEIGFMNYRNKIFKSVDIRRVMDKYGKEIEAMAIDKQY